MCNEVMKEEEFDTYKTLFNEITHLNWTDGEPPGCCTLREAGGLRFQKKIKRGTKGTRITLQQKNEMKRDE